MSLQFNRIASIEIGPEGEDGKRFSGFRISFSVKKTKDSDSNNATVEISNLSENSRNFIKEIDHLLILKAGYSEGAGEEILFVGNIKLINHTIKPPEILTKLEIGDGEKLLRESKLSLSYKEGFSIRQILNDIVRKMNVPNKVNLSLVDFEDKEFTNGYTFVGQTKRALDTLCSSANLEWSIQNNELKVQAKKDGDFTRAINLTPTTGLLGSPERLTDISASSSKKEVVPGWRFNCLLQPKAEPGGVIVASSREIEEDSHFKIHTVEHKGDTHGGDWQTIIEAVEL